MSRAFSLEEEERLISRARAGDVDALRPLLIHFADPLYSAVILPRVGGVAAAEDVLKDTFVTAIEKIRTFRSEGRSIYAWLRRIALHKVIDVHRRARRSDKVMAALAVEMEREIPTAAHPDEQVIAAEERRQNGERIAAVLAGMAPRYREAIQLRLMEELSREECARRLAIALGTFDVLLFRAIRAFRKKWETK